MDYVVFRILKRNHALSADVQLERQGSSVPNLQQDMFHKLILFVIGLVCQCVLSKFTQV